MNSDESIFDNLLESSVDGNVFLEDLEDTGNNVLEQAMKENMMDVWDSHDYGLLNSPLAGELKLDDMNQPTNYLEWINWDQKLLANVKTENNEAVPKSSSSDSGLSSDFHYDQQFSPSNEMDRASPHTVGGSTCGSVDVDNVSSPDTFCPSSPCSDIHMIDDLDVQVTSQPQLQAATTPSTGPSLVFPVSLKDLNLREIKAVKIIRNGSTLVSGAASAVLGGIKSSSAHVPEAIKKLLCPTVQLSVASQPSASGTSTPSSNGGTKSSYPPIVLSDEERRLLSKEGVELPTHYPLTKHEERELKRIRRKIRNKISAQDSRKRKRVYMDGLEDRVKQCSDENISLQKRIRLLETENKSLVSQLKRLQSILTGQGHGSANAAASSTPPIAPAPAAGSASNATSGSATTTNTAQPATCLLVLMLSFALFLLPNLRPGDSNKSLTDGRSASAANQMTQSMMKMPPFAGRSRALLQKTLALETDGDLSEMELEMALGGEVVVGEEDDEEVGLYVPLPHGPLVMGDHRGGSGAMFGLLDKAAHWGQKFGKQYPANPSKRSLPAFLAEHDYHMADPAAIKRARLRDESTAVEQQQQAISAAATYVGKEVNQSKVYEELAELANRGQQSIVHVRISSEEL